MSCQNHGYEAEIILLKEENEMLIKRIQWLESELDKEIDKLTDLKKQVQLDGFYKNGDAIWGNNDE